MNNLSEFRINKNVMAKFLFLLSFLVFVISVSFLSHVKYNSIFYPLKHFIILLPSSFVFLYLFVKGDIQIHRRIIIVPLLLFLIMLPFAIRGTGDSSELLIYFQLTLFTLSAFFYGKYLFTGPGLFTKRDIILLLITFVVPLVLDILFNGGGFIYNTYFSRPKLVMGYFHPKEGGNSLVVVLIFYHLFLARDLSKKMRLLITTASFVLLFFIDSRNSVIFYFNFLTINALLKKLRVSTIVFIYFIIPIVALTAIAMAFYDEIDLLTSRRLSLWASKISISFLGKGSFISDYSALNTLSKMHVDNYYVEYVIENGILFLALLLTLIGIVISRLGKTMYKGIYINAIFIPFVFACFFDAGMFSSGNFLNLTVWVIVFGALTTLVDKKIKTNKITAVAEGGLTQPGIL